MFYLFFFFQTVYSDDTCPRCSFSDNRKELISVPSSSVEIIIPNSVVTIYGSDSEHNAFSTSKNTLKSFKFEDGSSLETISKYSFYSCKALEEIDLSSCSQLKTIGEFAFYECSSVKSIKLPSSQLTNIDSSAFSYCSFSTITFPNTIETIGQSLLSYNTQLTSVNFDSPCKIEKLPKYLLSGCNALNNFTIPSSVTGISSFTERALGLINILVDDNNTKYASYDGVLYNVQYTFLYIFPVNRYNDYTIPKNITNIEWAAFMFSNLDSLIIPDTVITIKGWAFARSHLSSIKLSNKLNNINDCAFYCCSKLTSIEIPGNVKSIGEQAFYECTSLTEVKLPASLTELGGGIFTLCKNLTFTFEDNSNFKTYENFLTDNQITEIIYYIGKEVSILIPKSVETIKTSSFYNCQTITSVTFEEGSQLTLIEKQAFYNCPQLKNFEFPSTLKEIHENAFQSCSELTEVKINSPLTLIKEKCFIQCTKLNTLFIDSSADYIIGKEAFSSCNLLSSVFLSNNLKELGASCFVSCPISQLTLPSTVTAINESCFSNCGLTEVTFEENNVLTGISKSLFYQCRSLHTVNFIPSSVTYIGELSFAFTNITTFTLPDSAERLDKYCFQGCSSLTQFIIPENSSLETIDFGVFMQCENFKQINNSSPKFTIENEALFDSSKTTFYVLPPKSTIRYFSFPTTLRMIRQHALLGCKNLELIFIPENSVTTIYQNAFEDCINLKSINIPLSVKDIYPEVFKGCKKLECGLIIQNTTPSFLDSLVTESLLPKRCISECIHKCTMNQKNFMNSHLFSIFLVLSYVN